MKKTTRANEGPTYLSSRIHFVILTLTISLYGSMSHAQVSQLPTTGVGAAWGEIAHGKPAMQSSVAGRAVASLAVDGKPDTFSQTKTAPYVHDIGPQLLNWWKVDLQGAFKISSIKIHFHHGSGRHIHGVKVWVNGQQATMLKYVEGHFVYDIRVNGTVGETVYIHGGTEPLSLAEVEVFGERTGPSTIWNFPNGGEAYLQFENGFVQRGGTKGLLNDVVQVNKNTSATYRLGNNSWGTDGVLNYGVPSVIAYHDGSMIRAITDGPHWNTYLTKLSNPPSSSQLWVLEMVPKGDGDAGNLEDWIHWAQSKRRDHIVRSGDSVYIRRADKVDNKEIYLYAKKDGVLGLTNNPKQKTAFTIRGVRSDGPKK